MLFKNVRNFSDLICGHCRKQFSRPDALRTHVRDIHENAGIMFECSVCGKPAKSLNALKVHMSIYHRPSK